MWNKLFSKNKEKVANKKKPKPQAIQEKNDVHSYFKDHICSVPRDRQTRFLVNDNRNVLRKIILYFTVVWSTDIRARYMFRSYAAIAGEIHRQLTQHPYAIHPFSRLKMVVEIIFIISHQLCCIFVIYNTVDKMFASLTENLINACEIGVLINMITSFFTGYVDGCTSRYVVLELKKTAWRYTRTWFIVDLLFCVGLVINLFPKENPRWELILTSAKILRLPTLFKYISNRLEAMGASEVAKTMVEICLATMNYILWNIYFQSALEFIVHDSWHSANARNCSWMTITNFWEASNRVRLAFIITRAVEMLRQNSNMITIQEVGCYDGFFVISWTLGKILIIHCVMKYILLLLGLESAKARYFIMVQQVQTYMDYRRIPKRIQKKILKYYTARYQSNYFTEHRLMECVSGQLREDIIMHSGRQLVGEVNFLKQLPKSLLLQIGIKLKLAIFLAGDIIFKINTVGDCLYFIDKGTIAIFSESGQEICHLQDGDFFGEIALVKLSSFRTATAVAITNCELYRLEKKDFDSTIAVFPTVYEDIKKVALQRLERTIVIDEHHKDELRMIDKQEINDFL